MSLREKNGNSLNEFRLYLYITPMYIFPLKNMKPVFGYSFDLAVAGKFLNCVDLVVHTCC